MWKRYGIGNGRRGDVDVAAVSKCIGIEGRKEKDTEINLLW